jgi:hypothetical protein
MDGEKIDVARTVSAWAFCEQTGANKVAGGKKADDVLQVATGILPASPYDGRALFEDKTPDGVDYGPVSQVKSGVNWDDPRLAWQVEELRGPSTQ